jgi:hypothetical protein
MMSAAVIHGIAKPGRPWGSGPSTDTSARAPKSSAPTIAVAPTTAISTPGRRLLFFSSRITANVPAPIANAVQFVFPPRIASAISQRSRKGPCPSIEKPNSLGNWLISTVSAMPFM